MAHFAELDENNKVLRIIVVSNSDCMKDSVRKAHPDLVSMINLVSGKTISKETTVIEWEDTEKGEAFCHNLLGGKWVQTSYNNLIRKRYAGIGYAYDPDRDAFITPQPYPSWELDEDHDWQPPVPYPEDGKDYTWDEDKHKWVKISPGSL